MKPNPHLEFFENILQKHVAKAMTDRLAARRNKPSAEQAPQPGAADAAAPEAASEDEFEAPEEGEQEEKPRRVFMMPSEKGLKKKAPPPAPARAPKPAPLKPKVLR